MDTEGSNGVLVYQAGGVGLQVYQSGKDGVYVYRAGNPGATDPSAYPNGFEVAGAEGIRAVGRPCRPGRRECEFGGVVRPVCGAGGL